MMRLVADSMLSKLARWLRLGGISIENAPCGDDKEIISFVKRRRAILLTADEQLANRSRKRGFRVLLVREKDLEHQLAHVISTLGLKVNVPGMICPICNGKLASIGKKNVKGLVPENAYKKHRKFYKCEKCGKVYWEGTHWKKIRERYKKVLKIANEKKIKEGFPPLPRLP